MADPVLAVRNFSKSFDGNVVVNDLSFDVAAGETFAFLGANGSGKTTTIRCLLGLLRPTSGELLVNGKVYTQDQAATVGYLPEERGLYTDGIVLETMAYFGALKGMAKNDAMVKALTFLERVGLADKAKEKVKKLSSGQQQKVQLGVTVMNDPSLLVLDEPTKGLDPLNRQLLLDLLEERKARGATIVFITHQMEEVEQLADRLVMIKNGKRVLYGGVAAVKRQFGDNRIHLRFTGALPAQPRTFSVIRHETNVAEVEPVAGKTPQDVLKELLANHLTLTKFEVSLPSLQDIFVKVQNHVVE